jgi:hypothetical protein
MKFFIIQFSPISCYFLHAMSPHLRSSLRVIQK